MFKKNSVREHGKNNCNPNLSQNVCVVIFSSKTGNLATNTALSVDIVATNKANLNKIIDF